MPIVHIELLAGRTEDQKRLLVKRVTNAICESIGVKDDAVSMVLRDIEHYNYGEAGKLWIDK